MSRITIRKYPRNKDFYEVRGGKGGSVRVLSLFRARQIAEARRRIRKKWKKIRGN